MRILLLIVLLLAAGFVGASSNPPSPTPAEAATKPKADATQHKKNTEADKRGTKDFPVIIEINKPPVIQVETTNKTDERRDYSSSEWWVVYLTGALAFITLALAIYTAQLWRSTRNLVQGAENTAKRQLRAYVVIDKCKIVRLDGIPNTLLVHIIMKNCGQTPAHDVSCDIDILMDEMDKIISYTSKGIPIEQRESIHIVGTQSTFEIKKRLTLTKEGDFAKFNEGKFKIQIVTRIDYKDIFGDDQHFISTSISGDFFPSEGTGLLNSVGHWVLIPQQRGQNKAT